MSVHKDKKTGKWFVSCRYDNWDGARKQKVKRGFETKREALSWEREFLQIKSSNLDMTFESRSFTFAIDKLDADETQQQLAAASALARQTREVVIPEVDSYVYGVMAVGAGNAGGIADPRCYALHVGARGAAARSELLRGNHRRRRRGMNVSRET